MIPQPNFRCFQCSSNTKLTINQKLHGNYLKCGEPNFSLTDYNNERITYRFFSFTYDTSILHRESDFELLCSMTRSKILNIRRNFTDGELNQITCEEKENFAECRREIVEFLLACRTFVLNFQDEPGIKKNINSSVAFLLTNYKQLKEIPIHVFRNPGNFNGNNNKTEAYNLIHLTLDISWINLTTLFCTADDMITRDKLFEDALYNVLKDLIFVFVTKFENFKTYTDLIMQNPFYCICFKELWLLIQLCVEKFQNGLHKDFWHYFNCVIVNELNLNQNQSGILKTALISLWILYHVSSIQGYDLQGNFVGSTNSRVVPNPQLVETCLKIITNTNNLKDEPSMCASLHLLAVLQINWWRDSSSSPALNLTTMQQLWEYFSKCFNNNFSEPKQLITISNNSLKLNDFKENTSIILQKKLEESLFTSSYEIFLWFLSKFLTNNPSLWLKMKGRIFSKFSTYKLAKLTVTGLQNLIQLFFVLAVTINMNEMLNKLHMMLRDLAPINFETTTLIWNSYVSSLILKVSKDVDVHFSNTNEIQNYILTVLKKASNDRSQMLLMTIFVDGMKKLLKYDTNLSFIEYFLAAGWTRNYVTWCSPVDFNNFMEFVQQLLAKIQNGTNKQGMDAIERYIVPTLLNTSIPSKSSKQVIELLTTAFLLDTRRFRNILEHFTSELILLESAKIFLSTVLQSETFLFGKKEEQQFIIHSWIRIAILSENRKELDDLTTKVTKMVHWSEIIDDTRVGDTSVEDDPLYILILAAGARLKRSETFEQHENLRRWIETFFGKIDAIITPELINAETKNNRRLIMRIYTCAALLFLHCAPILYVKNTNTCLLYRLISILLLPQSIKSNKKPSQIILNAVKETWHLFVQGITRVEFQTDTYLQITLKELVLRYVPYLYDSSSPILKCLDDEFNMDFTKFILDKIATMLNSSTPNPFHDYSLQALKLTLEMTNMHSKNIIKSKLLANVFFPALFEQFIFNEDIIKRDIVLQIIKNIMHTFDLELKNILKTQLIIIIDKHLPFKSLHTFRLIESLISIHKNEMRQIIPKLKEIVQKIEHLREVKYDNTLRNGLNKLQNMVIQQY